MKQIFFKNEYLMDCYIEKKRSLGYDCIEEEQECNCGESDGYSVIDIITGMKIESICVCSFCYENCIPEERGREND